MEDLKYPVRYALLPVKAQRKNKEGEVFYIDECYIVSKAYVTEEHILFLEDGSIGGNYKVCFPYLVYSNGIDMEKKTPIDYKKKDHEATVFYLYDSYEEAKEEKDKRNILIPEETINKYQPLEDTLLELTNDMKVEKDKQVKIKRKI